MQKKWPAVQLVIVFISKQIHLNANIHIYTNTDTLCNGSRLKDRGKANSFTIKQIIPPRALHLAHPNVLFQVLVSPPEKNPVHFHLQEMEPCQQHS